MAARHTRVISAAALAIFMCACASLPKNVARTPSTALTNTEDTRLGRAVRADTAAHPGLTGIHPLPDAHDAFAARVLLAAAAERSLDLQYYIWHGDITGELLFEAAWHAAERGVRVRLLLDDLNTRGLDATIAALDAHRNVEVRVFNPFANRGFRLGDIAVDFARINRRMHNKSFTADNQVTIVGGRNVGDEYYGAESRVGFDDLDVLAVGPAVRDVAEQFDRYWNSESAYPAASVIRRAAADGAARLRARWDEVRQDASATRYLDDVRKAPLVQQLLDRKLPLEWSHARVLYDDPGKVLHPPDHTELHMLPRLEKALGKPMRELDLVSPYFVPGREATDSFRALGARGVKVRVLTNALVATDVVPVYVGYAKYREDLVQGGAQLFELKPDAGTQQAKEIAERRGISGSSSATLHAKTFAVDRERIFVGSFNLDPRSARLNTEMGIVIASPSLATQLATAFDKSIPHDAYEVRLAAPSGKLEWIERTDAGVVAHATEPGLGFFKRLWIGFLSLLPIESLL